MRSRGHLYEVTSFHAAVRLRCLPAVVEDIGTGTPSLPAAGPFSHACDVRSRAHAGSPCHQATSRHARTRKAVRCQSVGRRESSRVIPGLPRMRCLAVMPLRFAAGHPQQRGSTSSRPDFISAPCRMHCRTHRKANCCPQCTGSGNSTASNRRLRRRTMWRRKPTGTARKLTLH
jgi:hypothetical protein